LTSINLSHSDTKDKGLYAIVKALKVNSTLTTLKVENDNFKSKEVLIIANALRFKPSLSTLKLNKAFESIFQEILCFGVNTQHNLQSLLELLIDEDGAQLLAVKFRIKVRANVKKLKMKIREYSLLVNKPRHCLRHWPRHHLRHWLRHHLRHIPRYSSS
jgi:hypothetical protein